MVKVKKNLLKSIYEVNQNIILVLVNGSTISLPWASKNIPAIIEAWYPGQSGGKAIAEVLFGDVNPGGKLPMTFYKNIDQLPPFDDYDIRKGRTYMYLKEDPLYPFGYGLSYTDFSFTQISLNNEQFSPKDTIMIDFLIENADFSYSGTTNSNGTFTINNLIPGTYDIYAGSWGFHEYCNEQINISDKFKFLIVFK